MVDVVDLKACRALQTPAVEIEQRQRKHETLKEDTIRITGRNSKQEILKE